jgi:eukaryotic-like serine/threonine-protein kinase
MLGRSRTQRGERGGDEQYTAAAAAATAAGDDVVAANAWTYLLGYVALEGRRHDELALIMTTAQAAVQRTGDRALQRQLDIVLGNDLGYLGKADEALVHCDAAAAAAGDDAEAQEDARGCRARALQYAGKPREAAAIQRELVAAMTRRLGPDHPLTLAAMTRLAASLRQIGEAADALPLLERVVAGEIRIVGADNIRVGIDLNELSQTQYGLGRFADARASAERCLAIYQRVLPADDERVAIAHAEVAMAAYAQGDVAAARPHYEQSIAAVEAAHRTDTPNYLALLDVYAQFLIAQRDLANADAIIARGLAVAPSIDKREARALSVLEAWSWSEQGRHRDALPVLERAFAALDRANEDPHNVALLEMLLGRERWQNGGDRARAHHLVEDAATLFRTQSATSELATAEQWLAAHPAPAAP